MNIIKREEKIDNKIVVDIDIDKDQWKDLLQNKNIFGDYELDFIKKVYIEPFCKISAKELSKKYGGDYRLYSNVNKNIGMKIKNHLKNFCIKGDNDKEVFWCICMNSLEIKNPEGKGTLFQFILKDELIEAIEELDDLFKENKIHSIYDDNDLNELIQNEITFISNDFLNNYIYEIKPEEKIEPIERNNVKIYKRNPTKSKRALKRSNFLCENDNTHKTFIRKSNLKTYTEPHHLIPMSFSERFEHSLDVEANIVSLCSNCHNQLHYGIEIDDILNNLFSKREFELEKAGIKLNFENLKKMYN